jgi:hypothetical protein
MMMMMTPPRRPSHLAVAAHRLLLFGVLILQGREAAASFQLPTSAPFFWVRVTVTKDGHGSQQQPLRSLLLPPPPSNSPRLYRRVGAVRASASKGGEGGELSGAAAAAAPESGGQRKKRRRRAAATANGSSAKRDEEEEGCLAAAAAAAAAGDRGLPVYDASALAREVFAAPYFYNGSPVVAEQARKNREAVFGPDTTVGQVRERYTDAEGRFLALAGELDHCDFVRVVSYFAEADVATIEGRLAGVGIVTLEASDEIPTYKERRIVEGDLPSARRLLASQEGTQDRQYRLCFVLGSSGSGKTFFALQNLRDFRNALNLPSFTLYVAPKEFMSPGDLADRRRAPKVLVDKMKGRLIRALDGWKARYGQVWDGSTTLKMHVCVVMDEAGGNTMRRFFEDRDMVTSMLRELRKANIAESVMVAVVSTGLTAQAFDASSEAYVFRMRPWVPDDVEALLDSFAKKKKEQLVLKEGESTTRDLANAMYSLPLLEALSTNGRTAYYMVSAIAAASRRSATFCRQEWRAHLRHLVPSIVDETVFGYIASNAIRNMSDKARRRVAAWVLGSLSRLARESAEPPQFEGLDDIETGRAWMLLQRNVQRTNGTLQLMEDEYTWQVGQPRSYAISRHLHVYWPTLPLSTPLRSSRVETD